MTPPADGEQQQTADLVWSAEAPTGPRWPQPDRLPPTALTVMAEHCVDDPVWDRPYGDGEPVDLVALQVPLPLVTRLRSWNAEFEALALTAFVWDSPAVEERWRATGLQLAYELQDALPDVEVSFWEDGGARPVRGPRRCPPR